MQTPNKQTGEEWLEWRRQGIGASDAAAVLGISPWKTKHQLWLEKTGRSDGPEHTPAQVQAMAYGTAMEEEMRRIAEEDHDDFFMPECVVHPEYDFIRASLDGINSKRDTILECKACSRADFEKALVGVLPRHYETQDHHGMMCVPTVKKVITAMYHDGGIAYVIVRRDSVYEQMLVTAETAFWELVKSDTPPEDEALTNAADALAWRTVFDAYEDAKAEYEDAKDKMDALKGTIQNMANGKKVTFEDWTVTPVTKRLYNYKLACVDAGIDVTKYEKESTSYRISKRGSVNE